MNTIISVPVSGKNINIEIREDIKRHGKIIDLRTVNEVLTENVYQLRKEDLNDNAVVIDIGAHIGTFSLLAAAMGAKKVYAVEPNAQNFKILKNNILNNNFERIINIDNIGIAATEGKKKMIDDGVDCLVEELSVIESTYSKNIVNERKAEITESQFQTLAHFFQNNNLDAISVLKMDVEWSEYEIIKNTPDKIFKRIKYLVLEYHGVDNPDIFGGMIAKLSKHFSISIIGNYETGGNIFARSTNDI